MSLLRPYSKLPELNTANILLVEAEMELQGRLAEAILLQDKDFNTNVRMARSLPLPVQGEGSRPRIDLLVFIVNLRRESSLSSVESSLRHVDQGYCLGKLCFLATEARCGSVPPERLASLRKLAAAHCCPLLFMESQSAAGVSTAAQRLLSLLKVSAGLVPGATALYLSTLTHCTVPSNTLTD